MKVQMLRELLEGLDDDAEVRIATQPGWPLRSDVRDVVLGRGVLEDEDEDEDEDDAKIVWIVASEGAPYNESPYASRALWDR